MKRPARGPSKTEMRRFILLSTLLISPLLLPTGDAAAQGAASDDPRAAENQRITGLSTRERGLLQTHLEDGPVALVEFRQGDALPAVHFATKVRAPASRVAELVSDPASYPSFMPALDEMTVNERRQNMVSYHWTWRTAVFTLGGDNVLTVYPAPAAGSSRPYRIESRAMGGDLGTGRLVWRVYPDGDGSLLTLSMRLDIREANYFTRQIERGQNSINRTINISLAFVMAHGAKAEAERRVGAPPLDTPAPPLTRPRVDHEAMAGLLARGDLLLMRTRGERLDQVAVIGRIGRDEARTREVMTDPREFGPALVPGSYARVVREEANDLDFEWGINLPLIGSSGTMRLREQRGRVYVDATEGALRGGRWRFDVETYASGEAVVIGWGDFDPADASWLIRAVVADDPPLGSGIAGGTSIMVIRAIRSRAWRLHEARAAAARAAAATSARGGG